MGSTKVKKVEETAEVEEPKRKKFNPSPEEVETAAPKTHSTSSGQAKFNLNPELEEKKEPKVAQESKESEENTDEPAKKTVTPPAPSKKIRSKKYKEMAEKIDKDSTYKLDEAVEKAKETSYSKFGGSIELHVNTSVKNLRGLVSLPHLSGKALKIMAFGKGAAESGADVVGDDAALAEIMKGRVSFDVLVTTPEWMPKLARAAKVLGPRGLMPNPKNGTITTDLKKAVTEIQGGKVEYKSEKDKFVLHLAVGSVKQPSEEIAANVRVLLTTIGKTKVKKAVLSPTMGMGVKIDLSSL